MKDGVAHMHKRGNGFMEVDRETIKFVLIDTRVSLDRFVEILNQVPNGFSLYMHSITEGREYG